ncbi:hypothetical protein AB5I41_21240 [Sphingomonas sp. MMS24-JH45]
MKAQLKRLGFALMDARTGDLRTRLLRARAGDLPQFYEAGLVIARKARLTGIRST